MLHLLKSFIVVLLAVAQVVINRILLLIIPQVGEVSLVVSFSTVPSHQAYLSQIYLEEAYPCLVLELFMGDRSINFPVP